MKNFEVEFYEDNNGHVPVEDFLLSLDTKMRAKALLTISLLQTNGYDLREPFSKHLSDGIFELRIKQGTNITRILYFFFVGQRIILTNGFIKKTEKTPPNELSKAKKYRLNYLKRKEEDL